MEIREELETERPAVLAVHEQAFATPAEAKLIERLHKAEAVLTSVVAVRGERVVGNALVSRASIEYPQRKLEIAALGPVAVVPELQKQGVGSALVKHALQRCWELGSAAVIVLGNRHFYGRFGFARADAWEIRCELQVPVEAFMIAWAGAPRRGPAVAKYNVAFTAS